ncbi:MAG: hypothetical protein MI919_13750 [Holophagales bacterium]|nr:hypothetical protein [Holophagales bacterium]
MRSSPRSARDRPICGGPPRREARPPARRPRANQLSSLSRLSVLAAAAAVFSALLVAAPSPILDAQEDPGFKVIVNAQRPESTIEANRLSKIFLKKIKRWEDNQTIEPYDLDEKAEARDRFTRAIHRKSTSAIKSYWQRMIFSGRDVPPPEVDSDPEMIDLVAAAPGAVGYVSSAASLPESVKELTVEY